MSKTWLNYSSINKALIMDHLPFEDKKNGIDENSFNIIYHLKDGERLGPSNYYKISPDSLKDEIVWIPDEDHWITGPAFVFVPDLSAPKYDRFREKKRNEIRKEFKFAIVVKQMADLRIEIPPRLEIEDDRPGTYSGDFMERIYTKYNLIRTAIRRLPGISVYDENDNEVWNIDSYHENTNVIAYDTIPEGEIKPEAFTFIRKIGQDEWLGGVKIRDEREWLRDYVREGTLEKHGFYHLRGSIYCNGRTGERYDLSIRDYAPFDYYREEFQGPGYLFMFNPVIELGLVEKHYYILVRDWKNDGSWDPSLFEDKTPEAKPKKKGLFRFRKKK